MNSPVLGCCTVKNVSQITQQKVQRVNLINGYHVEWQNSQEFNLICEDEDVNKVISQHQDTISQVMALQHRDNDGGFLTVGLDNTIQVFTYYGENIATLQDHEDLILGVFELKNGDIVTVCKDNTLRFYEPLTGLYKSSIEASAPNVEAVQFFSNVEELAVTEPDGVSIWRFSGEHVLKLRGQKKALNYVYGLSNGNWLVWGDEENTSLWSAQGSCLKRFNFNFSYQDGFIIREKQLLIKNENGLVSLWDINGVFIDKHEPNIEIEDLFSLLAKTKSEVEYHIKKHPTINYYKHLRNFIQKDCVLVPNKELSEQKLNFENDPQQKELWDFFNRPIPRLLTTAMKTEIKTARSAEKKLNDKIETAQADLEFHQKKRRNNKFISFAMLFLTLLITSIGAYFTLESNAPDKFNQLAKQYIESYRLMRLDDLLTTFISFAGATLILCIIFFLKNRSQKNKQLIQKSNLTLLNALLPTFLNVIDTVKAHRTKIWRSVPLRQNSKLYNGESANKIIQHVIKTKLEKLALEECGLDKEDVTYSGHEAIILSDWAQIQSDEKRENIVNKLNSGNEWSFWGDENGSLIFAVQYIQFIFLTNEKIDLFTTFYDFISQKCIGKEANAFYYKDVTNISKREVERQNWNVSDGITATEISLSVASSDKIRLTILNEESFKDIVQAAKKHDENEKKSNRIIHLELEARKQQVEQDPDMDDEEKAEELADIQTQFESMNRDNSILDSVVSTNKADEAIKNIRAHIRNHKQEGNE